MVGFIRPSLVSARMRPRVSCALAALIVAGLAGPAGSSQWDTTRQGWPVLTLPGDEGLTREEITHRARCRRVEAEKVGGQLCVLNKGPESNQVHDTSYKMQKACAIDLSSWKDVLRVDTERMLVRAEPMVKMQQLADATLRHGMLPSVLPEFKHITVGGAIMGAALESSSHMHGDFLDGCRSVELLLGDGSIVQCSREERTDLFDALSGSYGTLGLLLSAEIICQPAFPFVEIKYRLYSSVDSGVAALEELCGPLGRGSGSSRAPFIDALALQLRPNSTTSKYSHILVMTADYPECSTAPQENHHAKARGQLPGGNKGPSPGCDATRFTFDNACGLWFFEHAYRVAGRLDLQMRAHSEAREGSNDAQSRTADPAVEVTELAETAGYLFRYDYGAFWMARPMAWRSPLTRLTLPSLGLFVASSPYMRWLTGWLFSTARLFRLLRKAPRDIIADRMIILDAYLPSHEAAPFIKQLDERVPISTPLWLCPVAPPARPLLLAPHGQAKRLMINVGVYGRVCDESAKEHSRWVEEEVARRKGRKMLYSHNFYTRDEFWGRERPFKNAMPSEAEYLKLRNKYGSDVFVSLYDKVCETSRPLAHANVSSWSLGARLFHGLASFIL